MCLEAGIASMLLIEYDIIIVFALAAGVELFT